MHEARESLICDAQDVCWTDGILLEYGAAEAKKCFSINKHTHTHTYNFCCKVKKKDTTDICNFTLFIYIYIYIHCT